MSNSYSNNTTTSLYIVCKVSTGPFLLKIKFKDRKSFIKLSMYKWWNGSQSGEDNSKYQTGKKLHSDSGHR